MEAYTININQMSFIYIYAKHLQGWWRERYRREPQLRFVESKWSSGDRSGNFYSKLFDADKNIIAQTFDFSLILHFIETRLNAIEFGAPNAWIKTEMKFRSIKFKLEHLICNFAFYHLLEYRDKSSEVYH